MRCYCNVPNKSVRCTVDPNQPQSKDQISKLFAQLHARCFSWMQVPLLYLICIYELFLYIIIYIEFESNVYWFIDRYNETSSVCNKKDVADSVVFVRKKDNQNSKRKDYQKSCSKTSDFISGNENNT